MEGFAGQDDLIAGKLIHPQIETNNQQEFKFGILRLVNETAQIEICVWFKFN